MPEPASQNNEPIRTITKGQVTTITLDHPSKRNALSPDLVRDLMETLTTSMSDKDTRVIVLTNSGTTFCAGADLASDKQVPDDGSSEHPTFVDLLQTIQHGPKPVVGRINGHCMGGGVGLAAACDISVINSDSLVGFTEVRLGVAPSIISVVCLPKISRAAASELFLMGERITASRAVSMGLLNRLAAPEEIDSSVTDIVSAILKGGPEALAACKQILNTIPALGQEEGYKWASQTTERLFASNEAAEGVAAFRKRRTPSWAQD